MSESPECRKTFQRTPTAELQRLRLDAEKAADEAECHGREAVLNVLIPTLDTLEREVAEAVAAMTRGECQDDAVVLATIAGVELARCDILIALERLGVKRFEVAIGEPFDSVFHEAVEHVDTPSVAPGYVLSQRAPGYALGTRVLRRALVVVSETPPDDAAKAAA
jgi:molecular chaperone GrpE